MCDTQTLAYSTAGYIVRCTECKRIQLAFGSVAIIIKAKQLKQLKERAGIELFYREICIIDADAKIVALPINANTMLCLSVNELIALNDLLDQAAALLEVYGMLEIY